MKKILLVLAVVFAFVFNANSQSYKIIGDSPWIDAIFYVQVFDSSNGIEIEGQKVEIVKNGSRIATAYTNYRGAVVFMFKGARYIQSDMQIRVYKENYTPWRQDLGEQCDILEYTKDNHIALLVRDSRGFERLSPASSHVQSISYILEGKFRKITQGSAGDSFNLRGFIGMHQYEAHLNYQRHPKNQQYHKVEGNSGYNEPVQENYNNRDGDLSDPFVAMAREDGDDMNYKGWEVKLMSTGVMEFTKGNIVLVIVPDADNWRAGMVNTSNKAKKLFGTYSTLNAAVWRLKRYMDNN